MKLVSDLLQSVEGISIWYVLSLLIFFVMFLIFLYRIIRKPAKEMEEIKNSILDENEKN
jgi:preprotein translocase subunit YajC